MFAYLKRQSFLKSGILVVLAMSVISFAADKASAQNYDPNIMGSHPLAATFGAGEPRAAAIKREEVAYTGPYKPGTVVVSTKERRLYFVLPDNKALKYGIGVGRPGFQWGGDLVITSKREWPDWTPPTQMLKRRPDLPRHMKGGVDNPLGARAMYLGSSLYRIHGSNEPDTIGEAVSSGCIRMTNDDVIDLFKHTKVGTPVHVLR